MSLIRKPPGTPVLSAESLIRKPDVEVFRDSTGVKVVRGTRSVAVDGSRAMLSAAAKLWLGMVLLVFILSGLGAMASAASWRAVLVLPLVGGAVWLLVRLFRTPKRSDEAVHAGADDPLRNVSVPLPEHLRSSCSAAGEAFHVDYWPRALTEKASLLAVAGVFLLATGALSLLGIYLLARAALIVSPVIRGDRRCVVADRQGLTVVSLIGRKTVPWNRIDSVALHKFGWRRQGLSLCTGTRRHVVVSAWNDFERNELLIPYQLLGLDADAAKRLAARILERTEAQAPRPETAPRRGATAPAPPAPTYGEAPEAVFDPDAIMTRYLGERGRVIAESRLPRPAGAPRGFGRKGLVAGD